MACQTSVFLYFFFQFWPFASLAHGVLVDVSVFLVAMDFVVVCVIVARYFYGVFGGISPLSATDVL